MKHPTSRDPFANLKASQVSVDAAFASLDAALIDEARCLNAAGLALVKEDETARAKELYEIALLRDKLRRQISRLQLRPPAEAAPVNEFQMKPNAKSHPPAQLAVARATLLAAAVPVLRVRKARRSGKTRVTFADGEIAFDFGEAAFSCPATGDWPGAAIVPAKFIFSWLLRPDRSDPVEIQIKDRDFHLNKFHTPCHWQPG